MRGALLLVVVMVSAGLAGCLTTSDDGSASEDGPEPTPPDETLDEPQELDVTLTPCDNIEAFASVDPALAREHVPDDFAVAPAGQDGQATVIFGGVRCGEDASAAERGFLAIQVEPRDEALAAEGVKNYFWEPEHLLVPGNNATDAFEALGANATNATHVNLTFGTTETTLEIGLAEGTHRITSDVPVAPGTGQGADPFPAFREYSAAQGGYTYLEARFQGGNPEDRGTAHPMQVQTAEGTVARELIGAEATLPTLSFEGFTFTDAKIGFVPRGDGG